MSYPYFSRFEIFCEVLTFIVFIAAGLLLALVILLAVSP